VFVIKDFFSLSYSYVVTLPLPSFFSVTLPSPAKEYVSEDNFLSSLEPLYDETTALESFSPSE